MNENVRHEIKLKSLNDYYSDKEREVTYMNAKSLTRS